jgi:hypothetical protein
MKLLKSAAAFILVQLKGNRDILNQSNIYNLNKEIEKKNNWYENFLTPDENRHSKIMSSY